MTSLGSMISRVSGFCCTECRAPLRYFQLLATMDNGRSATRLETVTCDACSARMRLADETGGWRAGRSLLGVLPEASLMVAIFFLIQWVLDVEYVAPGAAAGMVLSVSALFFPLVLVFAILENRFNHRVEAAQPLYDGDSEHDVTEDLA